MTKCICCGRSLKTESSRILGIGPECFRKSKKAGTASRRRMRWDKRVRRLAQFAKGEPITIGSTDYEKCLGGWWTKEGGIIRSEDFYKWLHTHRQIVTEEEVSPVLFQELSSGKSLEEILADYTEKENIDVTQND
jgi:hypothetical protein